MVKKVLLIFLFALLLFSFVEAGFELELDYPGMEIDFDDMETVLPEYVSYLFNTAIIVVGFIIFAAIVFGGIKYITSFGEPGKYGDAKKAIFSALLGGVVLLSAFIVFRAINPDLIDISIERPPPVTTSIYDGFYFCHTGYNERGDLNMNINNYVNASITFQSAEDDDEETKEAAVENQQSAKENILTFIGEKNCQFVGRSTSNSRSYLRFALGNESTIFAIPEIKEGSKTFKYGIIIHSDYNQKGRCRIVDPVVLQSANTHYVLDYNREYSGGVTGGIIASFLEEERTIRSITVYEIGPQEYKGEVTLYSSINLGDERWAHDDSTSYSYPARGSGTMPGFRSLSDEGLEQNVRSVDLEGDVFAILSTSLYSRTGRSERESGDPLRHCGIIENPYYNLFGHPAIGTVCMRSRRRTDLPEDYDPEDIYIGDEEESGRPCPTHVFPRAGKIL